MLAKRYDLFGLSQFDDFFSMPFLTVDNRSMLRKSITESCVTYECDVPGIKPDQISIVAEGNSLLININHRQQHTKRVLCDQGFNYEKTTAKLQDGVLVITIPKIIGKKIEIDVS